MMGDSPQEVYAKYLPKYRGYPLWIPQLSNTHDLPHTYQEDGIQIGDVGIVDSESWFNVLFNIRKPTDQPLHARWKDKRFPAFIPIQLDHKDITVKSDAVHPGTVVYSGVTRIDPPSHPSAEYEFAPNASEGAILILPYGAAFFEAISRNTFRDLAMQHAFDWHGFTARCLQCPIGTHSLYLITGFFKARCSSRASFKNLNPGNASQRVWLTRSEEGGNYDWQSAFHLECNDGPHGGPDRNADQCVFLRGFKITLRVDIFGLVTQRVTDLVSNKELRVVKWQLLSYLTWRFRKEKTPGMVSGQNTQLHQYAHTEGSKHQSLKSPGVVAEISEPRVDDPRTVNVITSICGDQLTGLGHAIKCHVFMHSGGKYQRTKDKPAASGMTTEWEDQILLPSESSAMLRISICTPSESTPEGKVLHTTEIGMEKLLKQKSIKFPQKERDSLRPSLLFTMVRKKLDDLDVSNFGSREELFRLAKAAERDKRWEDMANHVKAIAVLDVELTPEERGLFSSGYEHLIVACRASCDSQQLEDEIIRICEEVVDILDRHLIPSTISTESVVIYGEMVGDYYRCASDFHVGSRRRECIKMSLDAYLGASSIAECGLSATHPIRLRLALNLSSFYHEVLHSLYGAIRVADKALEDASARLEGVGGKDREDIMAVIQSLHDKVAFWKREEKEKLQDGQSDVNNPTKVDDGLTQFGKGQVIPLPLALGRHNKLLGKKLDLDQRLRANVPRVSDIIREELPRKRKLAHEAITSA